MKQPRRRVNWYLYTIGLVLGLSGAWVVIDGMRDGRDIAPIGWVAMLGAVYFMHRAYSWKRVAQNGGDRVSNAFEDKKFIFNNDGWRIVKIVMIVSLILSSIVYVALIVLSKHLSNNYVAGLICAYVFLGVASVATVCAALEVIRRVHRWLS